MTQRILAIVAILIATSLAWSILGGTLASRSNASDEHLRSRVQANWGTGQAQMPPEAVWNEPVTRTIESVERGVTVRREVAECVAHPLPLEQSRVRADLALDYRQKGLRWFSTYRVDFSGAWRFRNPEAATRRVVFRFPLPARQAIYDELRVTVDGAEVPRATRGDVVTAALDVAGGATPVLRVAYRSRGLDQWSYGRGGDVAEVRDFDLVVHTDFTGVDFPGNALSPTARQRVGAGWDLRWSYRDLVSGLRVAVALPEHLQPGPLAAQISWFAPVSLLFFFFLMFIITTLRGIELHPMNYFFLAAAFFAFHLLLAYLVDHLEFHAAFAICSLVSVGLVTSYLRLVIGARFALLEAGLAQLVYLVLFSYAFFFEGFTGLAVTCGAILTLFLVMQMTGRIRWAERFAGRPAAAAAARVPGA